MLKGGEIEIFGLLRKLNLTKRIVRNTGPTKRSVKMTGFDVDVEKRTVAKSVK